MIYTEYPISGDIRLPQMMMEWIFMLACIEIAIIFFIRYIRQDKELRNLQDLGYCILLLGFGVMVLSFIAGDYFAIDYSIRLTFLIIGYSSTMISALLFTYFMERYKKYLFKQYFFTFCFLMVAITFTIRLFIDPETSRTLSVLPWPFFLVFFIIFLVDFSKRMQNKEKVVYGLLKFIPGFLLLIIGFVLTTDTFEKIFGVNLRIFGVIFELISIILLSAFFTTLPPFSEFEWEENIEHIFVMDIGGRCLFDKAFNEETEIMEDSLVTGAISSVNILLEELTSDKGIVVINKKGKTIIIFPGEFVHVILFCKEELNYVKVLLKNFVEKFEAVYHNVLIDWSGNVDIFESTKTIVAEIFHQED